MIQPGAIVLCRQTGNTSWVVNRRQPDGRWRLTSKSSNGRDAIYHARTAGEGDLTEVEPAPTFTAGQTVRINGTAHTVGADLGDTVQLIAPDKSYPHPCGVNLRVRGGNAVTVSKSDLVLEVL